MNVLWARGEGGIYLAEIMDYNESSNTYNIFYCDGWLEEDVTHERITKKREQARALIYKLLILFYESMAFFSKHKDFTC